MSFFSSAIQKLVGNADLSLPSLPDGNPLTFFSSSPAAASAATPPSKDPKAGETTTDKVGKLPNTSTE